MHHRWFSTTLPLLCFVLLSLTLPAVSSASEAPSLDALIAPVADSPCQLETIAGGVRCHVADEPVFQWLHPSLFQQPSHYRDRADALAPAGPAELDDHYFYGVGNHLYRFDPRQRKLTERTRFPARIVDVSHNESSLTVTIEAPPHQSTSDPTARQAQPVDIDFTPDQPTAPGRGPWDWSGTLGPLHDVMWLEGVALAAEPGEDVDVSDDNSDEYRALEVLDWRQRHDATNPYIPLYRGEILQRLHRSDDAVEAFGEAVDHPGADWLDTMRIALRLQMHGHTDLARQAIERTADEMADSGIRGKYITAVVHATFGFVWLQPVMHEAITTGDADTADRVARLVDETFPYLEGTPAAWQRLAVFLDQQGAIDRAEAWRDRADEIRAVDRPGALFEETGKTVDLYLMLQIGLLLTAVLAGALLGLWRYDEDDAPPEHHEDQSEWQEYLPRFNPTDIVMLAGLFAGLVALPMMVAPQVQSLATIADAPPAASGDAVDAVAVSSWAETLAESDARRALLDASSAGLDATKAGKKGPDQLDLNQIVVEAVEQDTRSRDIHRLDDVELTEAAIHQFEWLSPLVDLEFDTRALVLLVVVLGMNALIFGALLQAVARRFDPVSRIGRTIVPGAPNSLRALRLPVMVSFFVGVMLMSPFSNSIQSATEASLMAFYGLEHAPAATGSPWSALGFALVVTALVVHAVGVVRDRRVDQ